MSLPRSSRSDSRGGSHMTLMLVSDLDEVKPRQSLQECRQTETGVENPANKRADADATPTLSNH
jgi:hypothetical protein